MAVLKRGEIVQIRIAKTGASTWELLVQRNGENASVSNFEKREFTSLDYAVSHLRLVVELRS